VTSASAQALGLQGLDLEDRGPGALLLCLLGLDLN
jgi:hypothetical protein